MMITNELSTSRRRCGRPDTYRTPSTISANGLAVEVAPQLVKRYATGSGAAPKDAVMLSVFKRWSFDPDNNNNLADAYVLARMGLDAADPADVTKLQRDILIRAKLLKD